VIIIEKEADVVDNAYVDDVKDWLNKITCMQIRQILLTIGMINTVVIVSTVCNNMQCIKFIANRLFVLHNNFC